VCVERAFWDALWEIADAEGLKLTELIARIDTNRCTPNLSSAIRLFVLDHYRRLVEIGLASKVYRGLTDEQITQAAEPKLGGAKRKR